MGTRQRVMGVVNRCYAEFVSGPSESLTLIPAGSTGNRPASGNGIEYGQRTNFSGQPNPEYLLIVAQRSKYESLERIGLRARRHGFRVVTK